MKVVFLDIDGVLNSTQTANPRNFPYIVDPEIVARLNYVLARTGAKVVLSSTWRYDPVGVLAAKHFGIPLIDVTPDLPHCPRNQEIKQWLGERSDVERFAVIDDEDDELDDLPLFQPSDKTGLDPETAEAVVAYLDGRTDHDKRRSVLARVAQNVSAVLRGHKG